MVDNTEHDDDLDLDLDDEDSERRKELTTKIVSYVLSAIILIVIFYSGYRLLHFVIGSFYSAAKSSHIHRQNITQKDKKVVNQDEQKVSNKILQEEKNLLHNTSENKSNIDQQNLKNMPAKNAESGTNMIAQSLPKIEADNNAKNENVLAQKLHSENKDIDQLSNEVNKHGNKLNVQDQQLRKIFQEHQELQNTVTKGLADIEAKLKQQDKTLEQVGKNRQYLLQIVDRIIELQKILNQQQQIMNSFVNTNIGAVDSKLNKNKNLKINAIIPGRVWISDIQGKTFDLGIGDELPGYGKITVIDPTLGEVSTSSGKKIKQNY